MQASVCRSRSRARLLAIAALPLSAALTGCATVIDAVAIPGEGVRRREYSVTVERNVAMVTRDGVTLVADIHHPRGLAAAPTILVRIPFSNSLTNRLRADAVARFWASRGYHAVIQGTRGRYKSGGAHYPLRFEREDGIDTLQWLARQPWFDGRLGMWGGSAFGYTQWVLADRRDPGPRALAIQIASTDFHHMFHPGGAFSLESALFWAVRSRGPVDQDPKPRDLERGFSGFPLIEADDRAAGDIPFFNDWVTHRERDEYWAAIDGEARARTVKAPVMLMAGWYDPFLPAQLQDFVTIRSEAQRAVAAETRLVVGPWTHAGTADVPGAKRAGDYRKAVLAPSVAWFDRHLRGVRDAVQPAPVTLYVMGDDVWRDEQEWPLARARQASFYLDGGGRLSQSAPSTAGRGEYVYDPRNPVPSVGGSMLGPRAGVKPQNAIENRRDVLVFTSEPLAADTEVTGPLRAVLYVSTDAPSTDFVARLCDVHPGGKSYNITDGIRRVRLERRGSEPARVEIDLWPTSNVFKRGHRIRVHVTSSSYPRFDRNPNTGRPAATETQPVPARQIVHFGGSHSSHLVLPIVPR